MIAILAVGATLIGAHGVFLVSLRGAHGDADVHAVVPGGRGRHFLSQRGGISVPRGNIRQSRRPIPLWRSPRPDVTL